MNSLDIRSGAISDLLEETRLACSNGKLPDDILHVLFCRLPLHCKQPRSFYAAAIYVTNLGAIAGLVCLHAKDNQRPHETRHASSQSALAVWPADDHVPGDALIYVVT